MTDPVIRPLTFEDLDQALGLSTAVGWNQRLDDWRMLLQLAPAGAFAALSNARDLSDVSVVGTAIGIDDGAFAWIAMMVVDPAYRGRAVGRRLLAVGGRILNRAFWREFLEIERVVAIKVAPFDRYRTLDVAAALAESGRRDVALYTGNDDAIVVDLLTPFPSLPRGSAPDDSRTKTGAVRFSGGLLGQWAVWTKNAVDLLRRCLMVTRCEAPGDTRWEVPQLLALGAELTDANAALFDPAHLFAGCIPGIHEVLRRQRLLAGRWCLDPYDDLSPGQIGEIDRVLARYPHLADDAFVREHLDRWLG
jgi:GNAT superfamily N-acetyltransferase